MFGDLPCEVWIADNSSVDDSVKILKHWQITFGEKLKIIENKENLGFAKANNDLINLSETDYLLLLNPDTSFDYDFLTPCLNLVQKHQALVAPQLIDCKYGHFKHYALFPDRKLSFFLEHSYKFKTYSDIAHVDWLQGACWFLPRKIFNKVGGFDEHYFLFTEDLEFCRVLHDLHIPRLLINSHYVYHPRTRMNSTKRKIIDENLKYYFRNRNSGPWKLRQLIKRYFSNLV